MLRLIIDKELREIIGSTKFAVTFGVMSLLILLAFYVGGRNYQVSMREYESAVAENLKQMEGLTDWSRVDNRIFLKPEPLTALVSGISNDIGRTVQVHTQSEPRPQDSRFAEDPIYAVFRFIDLEFVFSIVLSLFAILFAYDAVNGEKERGTLRLAFANAIPRDKYILGKLIGSFLALAVPLLIPILLGCLLLPILGVSLESGAWIRLLTVIAAGLMYLGVFLTLSIFVSSVTEQSSSSFLLLLVIWIFAVLIVPRTAVFIAGRAVDVPSVDEVDFQKSTYLTQLWGEDMKKMDEFRRSNPGSPGESQEDRRRRFRAYMTQLADARTDKLDAFAQRLNEDRNNRDLSRQHLALGIARISPASVFTLAATNLAGTSLELKNRFDVAARAYRDAYARFMEEKTGSANSFWWMRPQNDDAPEIDPYELPVFQYKEAPVSDYVTSALPDLALLLLFNLAFFAGAFVAFLRYDVR
jgi:ABC-type transport system involved in multi-copper enzyme maturation permease subunit